MLAKLSNLTLTAATIFLILAGAAPPKVPGPIQVHSGGSVGGTETEVQVSGAASGGNMAAPAGAPESDGSTSGPADPCFYEATKAAKGDPRLGGDDPSAGVLYLISCPDAIDLGTGALVYSQQGTVWARNGVAPIAPPPDPAVLAQQAAGRLKALDPSIVIGPHAEQLAVKIPIWLSVADQAPLTLTVAVPRLSVTVTATLTSTTWTMGEPVDLANPDQKVAAFTCAGTGTPAPPNVDPRTKPSCGYTYRWKSLLDRSGGTGTWPVTATTNWTVTWTASDGTKGTLAQPLTPRASTQVAIGEWRSTLVSGG